MWAEASATDDRRAWKERDAAQLSTSRICREDDDNDLYDFVAKDHRARSSIHPNRNSYLVDNI